MRLRDAKYKLNEFLELVLIYKSKEQKSKMLKIQGSLADYHSTTM
jgi:hypothetical protein